MTKTKRGRPLEQPSPFALPTDLLGYNIVRLAHLKKMRDDAVFKSQIGIGLSQFGALMMLLESPGLGAGQLARWLLITPQSTAVLLVELERLRLVEREKGRKQRGQRIKLHITDKGKAMIKRGQAALAQVEAEVRLRLSANEAVTLNRLLVTVAETYTQFHRRAGRGESMDQIVDGVCTPPRAADPSLHKMTARAAARSATT